MFLPTTIEEAKQLGWPKLDVILITGDAYIDSSFIGVAVIGKVLAQAGFRVGIIAQPAERRRSPDDFGNVRNDNDITRLGEPELFWGVTAGCVDSMIANYTPSKKRRHQDDFTPGGENTRRPDRASIVYSNLIRRYFKNTRPIVLGGIEASLRRIAHYDYWSDSVRRSILFDAKADILVYGMGEKAVLELANRLKAQSALVIPAPLVIPAKAGIQRDKLQTGIHNWQDIKGICYISNEPKDGYLFLPSYQEASEDKKKFATMFRTFYDNTDPITSKGLCQKQDTRYLIQNPPSGHLTTKELDAIYELDYENDVHPFLLSVSHGASASGRYRQLDPDDHRGQKYKVKALETIRFSITSHRGCYGECNFCAITVHQGRTVISRSPESLIREAEKMVKSQDFKGYISDVGGPTANMYGIECSKKLKSGACVDKRCIYPEVCKTLKIEHRKQIELLRRIRQIPGIKKVFIGSGVRHDLVMEDLKYGMKYLEEVVNHHTSGQLKIAPEHIVERVLEHMGKLDRGHLKRFKDEFYRLTKEAGLPQYLTYYLIAAHPGCEYKDMLELKKYTRQELKITPEQVQIFTPIPSTCSALMYYTGIDPFSGEQIFVEKDILNKQRQKDIITK